MKKNETNFGNTSINFIVISNNFKLEKKKIELIKFLRKKSFFFNVPGKCKKRRKKVFRRNQ